MATIPASDFLQAIKTGIAKVKDLSTVLYLEKGKLHLVFQGPAVRYSTSIKVVGDDFPPVELDIQGLYRLISTYVNDLTLTMDNNYIQIKSGRSRVRVPCSIVSGFSPTSTEVSEEELEAEDGVFRGLLKNHPLKNAGNLNLKKSLQAIKDNVTKAELVVEAAWGKSKFLKIKLVDQFHGILAVISLPEVPLKQTVSIRIPLSSFLNLLDIEGDLYVDGSKVVVKNKRESLECRFIQGSVFGTIEDMENICNQPKKYAIVGGKSLHDIVKKVASISENDDYISFSTKKENLVLSADTSKAEIIESISIEGKLDGFKLSPKNLLDITTTMAGHVQIADIGHSVIFKSALGDLQMNAAIVKMEA